MKFIRIFADSNCLLTVQYGNERYHEFQKLFIRWTDPEYLHAFFKTNEKDLNRPFWGGITVDQAVIETRNEAIELFVYIKSLYKKPSEERVPLLRDFFKTLSTRKQRESYLETKKAYGRRRKTWLRLYAIKAGDEVYIITGGAIKLTDTMEEREHTLKELRKLDQCRRYLISEGIADDDGMTELIEL